jgi:hypothetical protein
MIPETIPEAVEERVPQQRGSYFARHWRGDLSLPRSYWINGGLIFGLGCNIIIMMATMATIVAFRGTPALAVTVALGEVLLNIAAYIWALVGTWRSASKFRGKPVWSILAKVGMSLGVLISIGNVAQTLSVIGRIVG